MECLAQGIGSCNDHDKTIVVDQAADEDCHEVLELVKFEVFILKKRDQARYHARLLKLTRVIAFCSSQFGVSTKSP